MFQKEKDTERERGREGGRRQNKDIQGGRISKEGEERERRVEMRKERKKERKKERGEEEIHSGIDRGEKVEGRIERCGWSGRR